MTFRALGPLSVLLVPTLLASGALAQALISAPEGSTGARHSRGALVDCAEHGVWRAPEGWSSARHDRLILALSPDGSAAIGRVTARPRLRDDARFLAQASAAIEALAGAPPSLGEVVGVDHGRWRRERTVEGSVLVGGETLRAWAHADRTEALWIGVHRPGDAAARAAIEAAAASWLMLVDHACECGYDCDRRPE